MNEQSVGPINNIEKGSETLSRVSQFIFLYGFDRKTLTPPHRCTELKMALMLAQSHCKKR